MSRPLKFQVGHTEQGFTLIARIPKTQQVLVSHAACGTQREAQFSNWCRGKVLCQTCKEAKAAKPSINNKHLLIDGKRARIIDRNIPTLLEEGQSLWRMTSDTSFELACVAYKEEEEVRKPPPDEGHLFAIPMPLEWAQYWMGDTNISPIAEKLAITLYEKLAPPLGEPPIFSMGSCVTWADTNNITYCYLYGDID